MAAFPGKPFGTWGKFKEVRDRHGLKTEPFSHCFACNHEFTEEENVYFCTVKPSGNRFMCKKCAEKYSTEP